MPVSSSARVFRAISQPASLAKAHVATIADDDVVEHVHADQLAGINESSRERHVVRAWRRVAARVIVRHDDRGGVRQERSLEDLARLCDGDRYVAMAMESRRSPGSARNRSHITG